MFVEAEGINLDRGDQHGLSTTRMSDTVCAAVGGHLKPAASIFSPGTCTPEASGAKRNDFVRGRFDSVEAAGGVGRLNTGEIRPAAVHEVNRVSTEDHGAPV